MRLAQWSDETEVRRVLERLAGGAQEEGDAALSADEGLLESMQAFGIGAEWIDDRN